MTCAPVWDMVSLRLFAALLGTGFVLAACGSSDDGPSAAADEGQLQDGAGSYVGSAVLSALSRESAAEKGKTWSLSTTGKLTGDFVVQFPPADTWGKAELPVAPRCKEGEPRCDANFGLSMCATDTDCTGGGRCAALKATIAHHGDAPQKLCIGHSETQLDKVWEAVALAKETVDISTLSPPQGRFEATLRNALTYASESTPAPRVRMLFGTFPGDITFTNFELETLTRDINPRSSIDISLGTYVAGATSWNHSKIITRDGSFALVGGTNMWDSHELEVDPVHDLWVAMEGGPAADADRFLDQMWAPLCGKNAWSTVTSVSNRKKDAACPATFAAAHPAPGGNVPVISVGRLGALGAAPSDGALVAMVGAAKTSIRMAQQDIGPVKRAGVPLGGWPEALMTAMLSAMARGVDVSLVLTNEGAVPGGLGPIEGLSATYDNGWTLAEVAKKFVEVANAHREALPGNVDPQKLVCEKLSLMRLRSSDADTWKDKATLANHSKVIVVDDRAFYVGSQNIYVANLGEFGFIVDDEAATKSFIASYMNNAERWSRRTAETGKGVSCALSR